MTSSTQGRTVGSRLPTVAGVPAATGDSGEDGTRLGRSLGLRWRRPGPPVGRPRPSPIGSLASSSTRFSRGWGRPVEVRRALAGPAAPVRVRGAAAEAVAPPRWWAQTDALRTTMDEAEAAAVPRGLPSVVQSMPTDSTRRPGAVPARLAPETIRVRVAEDVRAAGRMLTSADGARPRSARADRPAPAGVRPSASARPSPPGNAEGPGRSSSPAPTDGRVARAPEPSPTTASATPGSLSLPAPGALSDPVVAGPRPSPGGRLLRRRALATATTRARTARAHAGPPARLATPAPPAATAPHTLPTPLPRSLATTVASSPDDGPATTPSRTPAGGLAAAMSSSAGPSLSPGARGGVLVALRSVPRGIGGSGSTGDATARVRRWVAPSGPALAEVARQQALESTVAAAARTTSTGASPQRAGQPSALPTLAPRASGSGSTSPAHPTSSPAAGAPISPSPASASSAPGGLAAGAGSSVPASPTPAAPTSASPTSASSSSASSSSASSASASSSSVSPGTAAPAATAVPTSGAASGRTTAAIDSAARAAGASASALAGPRGDGSGPRGSGRSPAATDGAARAAATGSALLPGSAPGAADRGPGAPAAGPRAGSASRLAVTGAAGGTSPGARGSGASGLVLRRLSTTTRPAWTRPGTGHQRASHRPDWSDDARRGLGIETSSVRRATRSALVPATPVRAGTRPGAPAPSAAAVMASARGAATPTPLGAPTRTTLAGPAAFRAAPVPVPVTGATVPMPVRRTATSTSAPAQHDPTRAGAGRQITSAQNAAGGVAVASLHHVATVTADGPSWTESAAAYARALQPAGWESRGGEHPGPGSALLSLGPVAVTPASGATSRAVSPATVGAAARATGPAATSGQPDSTTAGTALAGASRAGSTGSRPGTVGAHGTPGGASSGTPSTGAGSLAPAPRTVRRWVAGTPGSATTRGRSGPLAGRGAAPGSTSARAAAAGTPAPPATLAALTALAGTPAAPAVAGQAPALPASWRVVPPRAAGLRPADAPAPGGHRARSSATTATSTSAAGGTTPSSGGGLPASAFLTPGALAAAMAAPGAGGPPVPASASQSLTGTPATPGAAMSFLDAPPAGGSTTAPDATAIADQVEARVMARVLEWQRDELDDHVLELVERRLAEEIERRAWRRGTEVF